MISDLLVTRASISLVLSIPKSCLTALKITKMFIISERANYQQLLTAKSLTWYNHNIIPVLPHKVMFQPRLGNLRMCSTIPELLRKVKRLDSFQIPSLPSLAPWTGI